MSSFWDDKWEADMDYKRKICPNCGAKGKDLREEEDKTKILYSMGRYSKMYAKKNVCKKCGYEW